MIKGEEMEKELLELVCKSEEAVRAALVISKVVTGKAAVFPDGPSYFEFMETIIALIKKSFPKARKDEGNDFNGVAIPIKNDNYVFFVNFNWKRLEIASEQEDISNPGLEKALARKMTEMTGLPRTGEEFFVWHYDGTKYPSLLSVEEDIYFYRLYKLYKENPREVADRIIGMAKALEEIKE